MDPGNSVRKRTAAYSIAFHLHEMSQMSKSIETKSRLVVDQGLVVMQTDFFFSEDNVVELDSGDGCKPCKYTKNH